MRVWGDRVSTLCALVKFMSRTVGILLICITALATFACIASLAPSPVVAQEAADEGAGEPAAVEGHGAEGPVHKSRFMWFIRSSGLIGFFILLLSMYFIATIIKLFMEMKMSVAAPPDEVSTCEQLLGARDFQNLYEFTRSKTSFFSRLVASGIAELPAGLPEARELMDREAEAETVDMERKISMLAVIGSLGPMIGLIGTLKGMIASFAVIALSDTQLKASQVAEGISEALLLTFEGVALAVPAIFFFAFFRNRVMQISVETLLLADQYIRQAAHAARSRVAPSPIAQPRVPART